MDIKVSGFLYLSDYNKGFYPFCGIKFEIRLLVYEDMLFKGFSIFSSGGHFVQRNKTISAILVEGHPRNISVKLF